MPEYRPQITADRVPAEFDAAAQHFKENAADVLDADQMLSTIGLLTDAELIAQYVDCLPMVHRFVVAELDTEAPSKRGIARLADGDPPPRMGAKYRKQLRDDALRQWAGIGAERLLLVGFAAQFAFYPSAFGSTEPGEVWELWLRYIIGVSNVQQESFVQLRGGEQSERTFTATLVLLLASYGGTELLEAFESVGVIKGGQETWAAARAFSYTGLLIGAGRALEVVLSERVDRSMEAHVPVHLLESYAEKRGDRKFKAEVKALR